PARAVVERLLREHDADGSKKLDREEFMALAKALLDPSEGGSASGILRRIVQNVVWTTVLAPMFAYALRAALAMAAGAALGASWALALQTYVPIAVVAPVISVAVTMNAKAERDAAPIPVRRRGGGASGHRQSRRR
ncbi:MAG: hypothetical protein VXZ39_06980, partial [Planctomycetota bacterium]|nr:hypothetical protein [Planctomycetota bacterium]